LVNTASNQLAVKLESNYEYSERSGSRGWFLHDTHDFQQHASLSLFLQREDRLGFRVETKGELLPAGSEFVLLRGHLGFRLRGPSKNQSRPRGILGYAQVQDSPDMWYQTLKTRASYLLTGKVSQICGRRAVQRIREVVASRCV
jgi:hypothetical protein